MSDIRTNDPSSAPGGGFSAEQQEYLRGFLAALAAPPFVGHTADGRVTASPGAAATANLAAEPAVHGTPLGDLSKPEHWKHDEHPLDIWSKLVAHAETGKFPDEADTFRFKFHGLFYVAPAQDSFMLRLRLPAGEITSAQLHGLAELAAEHGGGYGHITTRANLQLREFRPKEIVKVLVRLQELGLTSRGSGADNIRNITASPTAGFDPRELIDVRPLAKGLHHYILNHRDLYGLPRKFNVAFEGGGAISAAADTNDLGFFACRAPGDTAEAPPAIWFRVQLGGISGHKDFARDTGLLIRPSECVAVAAAMIRVFSEHGNRSDRKKARLKYLLDEWGFDKFVGATQEKLAFPLERRPPEVCEPMPAPIKHGWIGDYRQTQRGLSYLGVGVPAGRLSAKQMHHLADLAQRYGQGELRLTVWQSVLIPHLADPVVDTVKRHLHRAGFFTDANAATAGIVACTGSAGCKYAAADTKSHALALSKALHSARLGLENPVNIHFTGCPHSCAQHYCGDIGLVGAKLADGGEGYHIVLGGGMGAEQGIAREIFRGVRAQEVPALVIQTLRIYVAERTGGETFAGWSRRHTVGQLQEKFSS